MNSELPLQEPEVEAAREKAQATAANDARTFAEDLKWLMSSPRGRRFMWWLLGVCGIYRVSFNNSGSVTAFNEGQRNVGLQLQAAVSDTCHASYLTMLDEQRKDK